MVLSGILVEFTFPDCGAPTESINVPNILKTTSDFVPTQQEDLKVPAIVLAV